VASSAARRRSASARTAATSAASRASASARARAISARSISSARPRASRSACCRTSSISLWPASRARSVSWRTRSSSARSRASASDWSRAAGRVARRLGVDLRLLQRLARPFRLGAHARELLLEARRRLAARALDFGFEHACRRLLRGGPRIAGGRRADGLELRLRPLLRLARRLGVDRAGGGGLGRHARLLRDHPRLLDRGGALGVGVGELRRQAVRRLGAHARELGVELLLGVAPRPGDGRGERLAGTGRGGGAGLRDLGMPLRVGFRLQARELARALFGRLLLQPLQPRREARLRLRLHQRELGVVHFGVNRRVGAPRRHVPARFLRFDARERRGHLRPERLGIHERLRNQEDFGIGDARHRAEALEHFLRFRAERGGNEDEIGHAPVHRGDRRIGRRHHDQLRIALLRGQVPQDSGAGTVGFDGQDQTHVGGRTCTATAVPASSFRRRVV
jgi:hypothetical protein